MTDEKMNGWLASTGFFIVEKSNIDLELLWTLLKSEFVKSQAERYQRGGMYPAILARDFKEYFIPLIQNRQIIEKVKHEISVSVCLMEEALKFIQEATRLIEAKLKIHQFIDNKVQFDYQPPDEKSFRINPFYFHPKHEAWMKLLLNQMGAVRLESLLKPPISSGNAFPSDTFDEGDIRLIRIRNIKENYIELETCTTIPRQIYEENLNAQAFTGDIVVGMDGDDFRASVIPGDVGEAAINQRVAILKPVDSNLSFYIACYINATPGQTQLKKTATQTTAGHITLDDIKSMLIPPHFDGMETLVKYMRVGLEKRKKAIDIRKAILDEINDYIHNGVK